MKLPAFLKSVDQYTVTMTHEQLEGFVHELARTLPEADRDDFLDKLKHFSGENKPEMVPADDGRAEIINEIATLIPRLEQIREGDLEMDGNYNKDWNDWEDYDEPEFLFSDPEDLLCDVQAAIRLVHKCVDMEIYCEGKKLAEALTGLEVVAKGDYLNHTGKFLSIRTLFAEGLISGDYGNYAKEALFLTYMGSSNTDRPAALYSVFRDFSYTDITLESILQMGHSELPEFDAFLPLWIDCLGRKPEEKASELLREAVSMISDRDKLLETARRFADVHPELYLQLLNMKADDDAAMLQIGQEALNRISPELKIRSEIALRSAYYADRLNMHDVRDQCWLEALKSDTSVINYLRIKFMTDNPGLHDERISSVVAAVRRETLDKGDTYSTWVQKSLRNRVSTECWCVLLYFEKRFDEMEAVDMRVREGLGWSFTFMGNGLDLLLLLLFQGQYYPVAMKSVLSNAMGLCRFSKEALYKGSASSDDRTEEALFADIIGKWKASFTLSAGDRIKWMTKATELVRRRTTGIMEANKRNHYGECARYIAALGEVVESSGEKNGKKNVMMEYETEYHRRRAFLAEMWKWEL
ncbi:MAG: hypothetical protein SOZ46_04625 [Bullifex sp.]|nr:hypothetical protein [Bullifex sp.]